MAMLDNPSNYDEEISLYELLHVLLRKKNLIIGLFLVSIIAAATLTSFMPVVYRATTMVEIGRDPALFEDPRAVTAALLEDPRAVTATLLEDPRAVIAKIETSYRHQLIGSIGSAGVGLPKITASNPPGSAIIEIFADHADREIAAKSLADIVSQLLAEHTALLAMPRSRFASTIASLELDADVLKNERERVLAEIKINDKARIELAAYIRQLDTHIEVVLGEVNRLSAQANQDNILAIILFRSEVQDRQRYRRELFDRLNTVLPKEASDLSQRADGLSRDIQANERQRLTILSEIENLRWTRVIVAPSASAAPISPNLLLNVALAGVGSLFLGVFLAFLVDYLEKSKQQAIKG